MTNSCEGQSIKTPYHNITPLQGEPVPDILAPMEVLAESPGRSALPNRTMLWRLVLLLILLLLWWGLALNMDVVIDPLLLLWPPLCPTLQLGRVPDLTVLQLKGPLARTGSPTL